MVSGPAWLVSGAGDKFQAAKIQTFSYLRKKRLHIFSVFAAFRRVRVVEVLPVRGNDIATESLVLAGSGNVSIAPAEPFFTLLSVAQVSIGKRGSLLDEGKSTALRLRDRGGVAVLGAMGDDGLAKAFSDVETMVVGREFARIGFVFLVQVDFAHCITVLAGIHKRINTEMTRPDSLSIVSRQSDFASRGSVPALNSPCMRSE